MEIDPKNGLFIPEYLEKNLENILSVLKPKHSLEFGTGTGTATKIIARYSEQVDTFETHFEWRDYARKQLRDYKNIIFHLGYFHTAMPTETQMYDFAFIDGPKGAPGIERITPFLFQWKNIKPGALCVFDDANQKGVRELFKLLKNMYNIDYKINNRERGIGEFVKP